MHRFIYRSLLDRPSTDTRLTCRSTVDRESTDVLVELPLMSAEVSTVIISGAYRSTTDGIWVNYRRNVSRVSFDSRARVYRYLLIYPPILSTNVSTYIRYYLPIYRPILSTDISTVLDPIYRYHRPMYGPIYWLILDTIYRYIDRYHILSTDILPCEQSLLQSTLLTGYRYIDRY